MLGWEKCQGIVGLRFPISCGKEETVTPMRWLLVFLLSGLFVFRPAFGTETDREREGLVGPVHTVVSEMAQLSRQEDHWVEEARVRLQASAYDAKGNLTEQTLYHPDGVLARKSVRTYGTRGTLTKEILYNPDDSIWRQTVYSHDSEGKISEAAHYAADGALAFKDIYTYDAAGNLTEFLSLDPEGYPLRKNVYSYGPGGHVREQAVYDADDALPTARNAYTYDATGNLTEVITYGRAGTLSSRWVYTYDAKGNQTQWIEYRPDGSVSIKQTYTYEFDATGNWIKKVVSEVTTDGDEASLEPSEVIYRTITYYPEEP